jgi:hypothetical protein
MWESENQDESPLMTTDNFHGIDRLAAQVIGARRLPIGLAMVARRPIDCLAILTASVASIVIIINAVFLQSGFRHETDRLLVSTLQKRQESLKSEGMRLQCKIDNAMAGIKSVETQSGARGTPSPMYFATKPPKRCTVSATHFW